MTDPTARGHPMCRNSIGIIENSIIDEPTVECGLDGITIDVVIRNSFFGRLYVQGESDDPNCVTSHYGEEQQLYASERSSDSDQRLRFSLKFGECNMRRQRTLNPRGVAYTFTLIVSFHPIFETEVDRAFRVRCFFTESVKALEATLDVSIIFVLIFEMYQMAGTGDGMLIHSCYVDDGQGKHVPVVDNKGCVMDPLLLSDIEYDNQAITAYAETRVFKYSDKIQLYFTCTIQLCVKNDGGCDNVTPPVCENAEHLTRFPVGYSSSKRDYHDGSSQTHHYDSEKEFFGPIDATRKEIRRNLHFTPPLSLQPAAESSTSAIPGKVRARRGIHPNNSLKISEMRIAEMDLTAHVVVFPLIEANLSNVSPQDNKEDILIVTSKSNWQGDKVYCFKKK
uniref:ZP domain-containing protein n=1 Tax=Elaeophora elaphi TaxID=1147741 RepID=A0A158Q7Y6_9BILA